MKNELTISKPLAPEDIQPEMYVAALFVCTEYLPGMWCDDGEPWKRREVKTARWLPCREAGLPLRVVTVCLPFVLVEKPCGTHESVDVRRVRLARLSDRYGRKASKRLRPAAGKGGAV